MCFSRCLSTPIETRSPPRDAAYFEPGFHTRTHDSMICPSVARRTGVLSRECDRVRGEPDPSEQRGLERGNASVHPSRRALRQGCRLQSVPDQHNLTKWVESEWREINTFIQDGTPHTFRIWNLERRLDERRADIDSGKAPAGVDWADDLRRAEWTHKHNLTWIPRHEALRNHFIEHWTSLTRRSVEYSEKIALAGFNTILLLHGAVAVGALNALSQKAGQLTPQFIIAAKCSMFGALAGILLLACGQILQLEYLSRMSSRVAGSLLHSPKLKKFNAISRYWGRHLKRANIGAYMVYMSLFWFFLYCSAAFLILL